MLLRSAAAPLARGSKKETRALSLRCRLRCLSKEQKQKQKTHTKKTSLFFLFFLLPPPTSSQNSKKQTGLLNIQYCVQDEDVYIIEANPRASRTVPFVAKAVGHPLAAYASLLMSGMTLKEVGFEREPVLNHVAVKEAVLPFEKFAGADTLLGPEMKSTGEVMGIDTDFGKAYAKAAIAAGSRLPPAGSTVFITMTDKYKDAIVPAARQLVEIGYKVVATSGTAAALRAGGVECAEVLKIQEGRPNAADLMRNGEIDMMFITSTGDEPDVRDGKDLRRLALSLKVKRGLFFLFFFFFFVLSRRLFFSFFDHPKKKKKKKKTHFSLSLSFSKKTSGLRHDDRGRGQGHGAGPGRDEGRAAEAGADPGLLPGDGQGRDQVRLKERLRVFGFFFFLHFGGEGQKQRERERERERELGFFLHYYHFHFLF